MKRTRRRSPSAKSSRLWGKRPFRTVLLTTLILTVLFSIATPIARRAYAATCPPGSVCIQFSTFWSGFTYIITGGITARSDFDRWVDFFKNAKDQGVDCSGAANTATALQAAIDALANGSTLKFPHGCKMLLSSTINITDRNSISLIAESNRSPSASGSTLNAPEFRWNGTGGSMFFVNHSAFVTFTGLTFTDSDGVNYHPIDKFINFDGEPVTYIGTAGSVTYCSFNYFHNNTNFKAVSISETAGNNHENYTINNNSFSNSSAAKSVVRARTGVITNGSPNLAASGANFVSGDAAIASFTASIATNVLTVTAVSSGSIIVGRLVLGSGVAAGTTIIYAGTGTGGTGTYILSNSQTVSSESMTTSGKRIRVSYASGMLDTTILSVTDSNNVVMAANATSSQSNATVIVGRAYGVGIFVGLSANAKHHTFNRNAFVWHEYNIYAGNGSLEMHHMSSLEADHAISIYTNTETTWIDYYEGEGDFRAIEVTQTLNAPVIITNMRANNGYQPGDGYLNFKGVAGGDVLIVGMGNPDNGFFTNSVLIGGLSDGVSLTVSNNYFNGSWAQVGLDRTAAQKPVTAINNTLNGVATGYFGSLNKGALQGTAYWGEFPDATVIGHATNWRSTDLNTPAIGVRGSGASLNNSDTINYFIGVQGVGLIGRFQNLNVALEGRWDSTGIDANASPTAAYTMRALPPASVAGTLPDLYGLFIGDHALANVTRPWGAYQVGLAPNYFEGPIRLKKRTASGVAPGAASAELQIVCGTNSGTAKIIAYAGTSTTPVTVLDNIGSGVSGCLMLFFACGWRRKPANDNQPMRVAA